jgi:hypothetical protein
MFCHPLLLFKHDASSLWLGIAPFRPRPQMADRGVEFNLSTNPGFFCSKLQKSGRILTRQCPPLYPSKTIYRIIARPQFTGAKLQKHREFRLKLWNLLPHLA